LKTRASHIWDVDPHGHYPEPSWVSARLFATESFGTAGALIVDPACGWGRIPHNALAAGYAALGVDIVDRRQDPQSHNSFPFVRADFLTDMSVCMSITDVTSVVMNPPYEGDNIQKFVTRALAIAAYKVAALVPLRRLPAARWLQGLPLGTIYLLTPRPSLPPASYIRADFEPGGGGQDFAWLIFNVQAPRTTPTVRWLSRDDAKSEISHSS
jgi:hypothetical protein